MWDEEESKVNRHRSQRQERRVAKEVRGTVTPNSGATPFGSKKGDVQTEGLLIEAKLTNKDRFTVTESLIRKVNREAYKAGKKPCMVVTLEALPNHVEKDWVLMPLSVLKEIMED